MNERALPARRAGRGMASVTNSVPEPNMYDMVAFPSMATPASHPDHLAAIARLHGLSPPAVATARVLDIGGGDGINVLAMAEALPDARFLSIDLAERPVVRGRAIAAAAGITNVRIDVADILDAAQTLDEPFDYVIAHGVYAWTPRPVREALMALIGRVLTVDGVAYVSYNALPGSHYRRMVREMTLHELEGIADPAKRYAAAQQFLGEFAAARDDDPPPLAALRTIAAKTAASGIGSLLHDELGDVYEPQAFKDVVAAAAGHGLRFLNDADPARLADGFPGESVADDLLVHAVQSRDYAELRYFHKTALVREGHVPARSPSTEALRRLYVTAPCEQTGPNSFKSVDKIVTISDEALARAMATAVDAFPRRLPLGSLVEDDARVAAFVRLFGAGLVTLHTVRSAGAAAPGSHPRASGLARALVEAGETTLFALDHRTIIIDEPGPRALLLLLDGTRDHAALAAAWQATGHSGQMSLEQALAKFAALSLLAA